MAPGISSTTGLQSDTGLLVTQTWMELVKQVESRKSLSENLNTFRKGRAGTPDSEARL